MNALAAARTHAVIVNYNAGPWLSRSVSALLKQESLNLTVVDNGSRDNSLASIEPWVAEGRIRLIQNARNVGFGAAVNQAWEGIDAEFVLLLNPDCELDNGALKPLQYLLDGRPQAGIVGVLVTDEQGREQRATRRRLPTLGRSIVTLLHMERWWSGVNIRAPLPVYPVPMEAVSGAVLFIRNTCFRDLGGFDEAYFLHCEDLDLFVRAKSANWEVWFHPGVRAVHAGGVCHRHAPVQAIGHKRASMVRYYRHHIASRHARWLRWFWPLCIHLRFGLGVFLLRLRGR